jgi:predicted phosphodiesterase
MTTLIVSDLHLGTGSGTDMVSREELRAPLLEAVAEADRVVLLGDVLELRHGPMRDALEAARPFFEDLGRALAGRASELVIVAGNHDHALVEPWLAHRGELEKPPPLGLEQMLEPAEASPALERIAAWAQPARTRVAYPGLWVRDDVYAMHGHYLDCHLTVPTLERLTIAAMSKLLSRSPASLHSVADYESLGAPLFAWRDAVARDANTGAALNGMATVSAWATLMGGERQRGRGRGALIRRLRGQLRRRAIVAGFPLAVAALNRAGMGPLGTDVSLTELRRAGLRAMGEVAARLELGDAHVVFGHTHRPGPLADDDQHEWRGRGGARLINTGSWTFAGMFLSTTPGESPYWPGSYVLVEDHGAPKVERLLLDRSYEQIYPIPRRSRQGAPA